MGQAAEDVSTNSNLDTQANVDPTDAIANLLIGDDKEQTNETGDSTEEEIPANESTEEVNESEEEEQETETPDDVVEEIDDEQTWESVLGVEEDKLSFDENGNIAGIHVKVNGKSSTVGMKDLIAGYQNNKSFTEKSKALAEDKKGFEQQRDTLVQDYITKLENVEAITNYLSNKLVQEFEGIDWNRLKVEQPEQYAAAKIDYQERAQELQLAMTAIQQDKKIQLEKNQEEFKTRQSEYVKQQYETMLENNPDWQDKEKRVAALTGLQSFAENQYGFTEQEFNSVMDARLFEVIKDAKAYREGVKTALTKRKKSVPKFQKSSGTAPKKVSKLDKLTKAAKKAKGHQKRDLQSAAVAELLLGGN